MFIASLKMPCDVHCITINQTIACGLQAATVFKLTRKRIVCRIFPIQIYLFPSSSSHMFALLSFIRHTQTRCIGPVCIMHCIDRKFDFFFCCTSFVSMWVSRSFCLSSSLSFHLLLFPLLSSSLENCFCNESK